MKNGTARIISLLALSATACSGGGDGGINQPVTPVVTTVEISPSPVTVFMGDTIKLTATAKDQNGSVTAGKTVSWSSDATSVATIDTAGTVVAKTSGTARISATVEGKTGSVALTSTGPGTTGAVTGSALVTTAGGTVQATLPGGGTMNLTVPAGALRSALTITVEPIVPPPGALASFRLTPAGVRLDKPATLVIKVSPGAKLRTTSTLVLQQDGQSVLVPGVRNLSDGTMTVSLGSIGLADTAAFAVASRVAVTQTNGSNSATGTISNMHFDAMFGLAAAALDRLKASGTISHAEGMQQIMETLTATDVATAIAAPGFTTLRTEWATTVCANANFAFNALSSFNFVSDYRGLERVVLGVVHWHRVAKTMNEYLRQFVSITCFNSLPDPQVRIHTRLTTLEPNIISDLNGFALEPAPRDSAFFADRLKPLSNIGATLQLLAFDTDAQIVNNIVSGQLARVRQAGYARCRSNPSSQEIQGRLARNLVVGPLPGLALEALQSDIELCGMSILWNVLDTAGTSVAQGALGGGDQAGEVIATASASLVGNGQVKLSGGTLQALLCPSPASANNEQLEVVAGRNTTALTRVALLSPSNANQYLSVSSLLIPTDTLRAVAGLSPTDSGLVTIVVRRTGGVCSGLLSLSSHSPIATLRLTLLEAPIYFKNFNSGPAGPEWSTAQTTTSPSGQRFLGELGNGSTTLTLDSLPSHTQLTLDVDIYIIDSWNGNGGIGSASAPDIVEISVVGGPVLKRTTFSNKPSDPQAFPGNHPGGVNPAGTGAIGKSTLGYDQDPDHFGDSSYRLRLTFAHTGGTIAIRFASQQTSGQNERWGIDNVRLTRVP
jgi:hypothetical protein